MVTSNQADQNICKEMVTKIAHLAKLRLTPEEASQFQHNFSELLLLFHELDNLDISKSISTDLTLLSASDCREDIPVTIDNTSLPAACPFYNQETSYFDVPQFIEYDNE